MTDERAKPTDSTVPDETKYNGYLKPWVKSIVQQYQSGVALNDIAKGLRSVVPRDRWSHSGPTREHIIYVLRRSGVEVPTVPPSPTHLKREAERITRQRRRLANWLEDTSKPTLGRPLDMGGPRDVWLDRSSWDEF